MEPFLGVTGKPRGVLFDLDGTLLDHRGAADAAVQEWTSRIVGVSLDAATAVERWRLLEARYFTMFEQRECTFQEQRRLRVRAFAPTLSNLDDEAADELFAAYQELYRRSWRPVAGAAEIVARAFAAGCRVGVLTNGDESQQGDKLAVIGLAVPGLALFASSALGCAKPDPRAFELACSGLGTGAGETVMIGDDYAKDIVAARAAGLRAFQLTDGVTLAEIADDLFGEV